MTCEIKAGNIYKIPFPFTDLRETKVRPALALTDSDAQGDARFLFITVTPPSAAEQAITLDETDFSGTPLPLQSHIRLDKSVLLHKLLVIKPWAQLTDAAMARVYRAVIADEVTGFDRFGNTAQSFVAGQSAIPPSGKVIGVTERQLMVEASLDGWLTTGRFNKAFEQRFAEFVGVPYALTTTSGSAANLLALTALTSPKLGERALKPGDEVITVAAGFPTTVNPILQNGMVPVFVDVDIPTYNIDPQKIEAAVSERTRAIMIAHTLGNPFDLAAVIAIAQKYNLWVIEDCCDALGSLYKGRHVGTFGHIATCSFYPAHHITMGEGGMVFTQDRKLKKIVESFRDWGRDCYCAPGCDDTCRKRFGWQLGSLPQGYDHKYTYSHLGYNLNISDMQAACALAQMDRLPDFIAARKRNFAFLKERLKSCEQQLILPEATADSDPSWFGFPITLRESAGIKRVELLKYLDQYKIGTRMLFAGNLTRQPYFVGRDYRISGELTRTDDIMNNTLWIGVYPGLNEPMLDYVCERLEAFLGINV
ncbi:MAG: lipopolysaccharide biosynthesis protein RfbH [Methylobacter sp.]|nr:lipopolysaccharide biosynthesis protein RfbH [Methylobacter sp.]